MKTSLATLKAGVLYFAVVFSVGFVLGTIRTLWVAPSLGARKAELMEAPIMILVSAIAARWVVRCLHLPSITAARLGMGILGLALMIAAEFTLALWLRRITIAEYFATRDPVSGTAYVVALVLFALMPLFVART